MKNSLEEAKITEKNAKEAKVKAEAAAAVSAEKVKTAHIKKEKLESD